MVPLKPEEYEDVILNPKHWEEPHAGSVSVRISATEAGERAYRSEFEGFE